MREGHRSGRPPGQPVPSPECGEPWPSAVCALPGGVNREVESWSLGLNEEMTLQLSSHMSVRPAGLLNRLQPYAVKDYWSSQSTGMQRHQDRQEEMEIGNLKDRCKGF